MVTTLTRRNGEALHLIVEDDKVVQIKISVAYNHQIEIAFDAPDACRILQQDQIHLLKQESLAETSQ